MASLNIYIYIYVKEKETYTKCDIVCEFEYTCCRVVEVKKKTRSKAKYNIY